MRKEKFTSIELARVVMISNISDRWIRVVGFFFRAFHKKKGSVTGGEEGKSKSYTNNTSGPEIVIGGILRISPLFNKSSLLEFCTTPTGL